MLERYSIANALRRTVGDQSASVPVGEVAEIVLSRDGALAYALNTAGEVHVIDLATMTVREVLAYDAIRMVDEWRPLNTNASISPDGRYLVINSTSGSLQVHDLVQHTLTSLETPRLRRTFGVAFNYNPAGTPIVAVHGQSAVAVYQFNDTNPLGLLAWTSVQPQSLESTFRVGSLAWTGRGDAVVAAIGAEREFRVLDYRGSPAALTKRFDFNACTNDDEVAAYGSARDVATIHDRPVLPTPTSTATPPPTATATATPTTTEVAPTVTLTPSSTPTTPPSPTPTATPSPRATVTATATSTPAALYLPVLLKEHCSPGQKRLDVALVIDASTSMQAGRTREGRSKLDAAVEAVGLFLDQLALPNDQAAIVEFNSGARLLQELTGDRAALAGALGRLQAQRQTRIDLGIVAAHAELVGMRRRSDHQAVMILLTDGLANPEPASTAVLRAAEAKDDAITIFTICLGQEQELNVIELTAMASQPEYFYRAPDGEDLLAIYRTIAVEIPCPTEEFWGRR